MTRISRLLLQFLLAAVAVAQPGNGPASNQRLALREGWSLQTSAKVTSAGEAISSGLLRQFRGPQEDEARIGLLSDGLFEVVAWRMCDKEKLLVRG